jgi:hypothetical protein
MFALPARCVLALWLRKSYSTEDHLPPRIPHLIKVYDEEKRDKNWRGQIFMPDIDATSSTLAWLRQFRLRRCHLRVLFVALRLLVFASLQRSGQSAESRGIIAKS